MRAAVACALAAGLVACSGPDQFELHLSWSSTPGRQTCPVTADNEFSCAAIPMSCDARVRLRIVDDNDDTRVFFTECYDLPAGGDLCGLGGLRIPAGVEIPNQMVRIQLQVWSVDELAALPPGVLPPGSRCPIDPRFDQRGLPLLDAPVPAVGGEIYFPVGDGSVAELVLGCPDYDQLDTQACRNRSITIDAAVLVPGSWRSVTSQEAEALDVQFGAPRLGDDGLWRLPLNALTPLEPTTAGELRWRGSVPGPIEGLHCLHVLQSVAMATPVATCALAEVLPSSVLPVLGFRVERTQIDKLTALANRMTGGVGFPIQGMVLGLVVDENNLAVANAVVTPSVGTVAYLDATLDNFIPDATGTNGLFLALDTPLDTTWAAVGPGGSMADGTARGGLIADHVSIVVVRMRPPPTLP